MTESQECSFQIHSEMEFPFLEAAAWISSKMKRDGARIRSLCRVALTYHYFGASERGLDLLADAFMLLEELNPEERTHPGSFALLSGALYHLRSFDDSENLAEYLSKPAALEMVSNDVSAKLAVSQMRFFREEYEQGWTLLKGIDFEDVSQEEIDETFRNMILHEKIPLVQWNQFICDSKYEDLVLLHFLPILACFPDNPAFEVFNLHSKRLESLSSASSRSASYIEEEIRYLIVSYLSSRNHESRNQMIARVQQISKEKDPASNIWCGKFALVSGNSEWASNEFQTAFGLLSKQGISLADEEFLEEIVRGLLQTGTREMALDMISSLFTPERRIRLLVEFQTRQKEDEQILGPLQALVFNQGKILDALAEALALKERLDWISKLVSFGFRIGLATAVGILIWMLTKF